MTIARYPNVCLWHSCIVTILTLTRIENNYMTNYSGDIARRNHKPSNLNLREVPQFSGKTEVGVKKAILGAENRKYL